MFIEAHSLPDALVPFPETGQGVFRDFISSLETKLILWRLVHSQLRSHWNERVRLEYTPI